MQTAAALPSGQAWQPANLVLLLAMAGRENAARMRTQAAGMPDETTEAALAAMVQDLVPGLVTVPGPPAWNEGRLGPLLIEAAGRDFGYVPRVSLRDGLAELATGLSRRKATGEGP